MAKQHQLQPHAGESADGRLGPHREVKQHEHEHDEAYQVQHVLAAALRHHYVQALHRAAQQTVCVVELFALGGDNSTAS